MAAESPTWNRPDDPLDVGKYPRFDGTNVAWVDSSGTMDDHATPTGTTETLSLISHRVHRVRWDANLTLTLSNVPSGWASFRFILYHENTSTSYTLTWFAGAKFDGGVTPSLLSNTANSIAIFECWTWDGGTTWVVAHGGNFT